MKKIVVTMVAIGLLVGLFIVLKPHQKPNSQTSTNAIQQNVKQFELVVKDKKLASGPAEINVAQGDQVTIKITSDQAEELHLHGYDKSVELEKDQPAEISFKADLSGRFEYELEQSKMTLGALQVAPK